MSLVFKIASGKKRLQEIYNYNAEAFSEIVDIKWDLKQIKDEVESGWVVYSVSVEEGEIIAVCFVKEEGGVLRTKNTPIKIAYQGNEYSHRIKEFYESLAKKNKIKKIISYCSKDNFRMISLNQTHKYTQTKEFTDSEGHVLLEWTKILKK